MKLNSYRFEKWDWFPISIEAETYKDAVKVVNQFLKKQYRYEYQDNT